MDSHGSYGNASGRLRRWSAIAALLAFAGVVTAAIIDMTHEDFFLSGTQIGDVPPHTIWTSHECVGCHGPFDPWNDPVSSWEGSLMAQAARDPLFLAQLATANQDVGNVGYYCLRCHAPMSFVTGNAWDASGQSLNHIDKDGVTCHFCHSMVDPIYRPGISPVEDLDILENLESKPEHYGNAMFVLDPTGLRRGPRDHADPPHDYIHSPFHKTGEFCGTCHDVGNVAITRQPDGTYRYNEIDQRTPDEDPHAQFPLERTYTEWKLSEFADGGVNMHGRFGGEGVDVVSTCQDCHMPKTTGKACNLSHHSHDDLARHEFAGASAWVLEIIALYYRDDDEVYPRALRQGALAAVSMLKRAATLDARRVEGDLVVRVTNETGHKLPTGHIEGRRVFINVKFFNHRGRLIEEFGQYDFVEAHLDEDSTKVYEMAVGLSDEAARITGLPSGRTTHMALADVIVKDNRIPPRGFENGEFEDGGAPVVGYQYDDGQHWDDTAYPIPRDAVAAKVTLYYQTVTRHYIEALHDGNETDHWGKTLYELWLQTDKAPPIQMATRLVDLR